MTSDSSNVQQLFERAVGFLQQRNLAEAERHCLQILSFRPDALQASLLLGVVRSQQGRHDEALALIGDVLKINPQATAALLNYGNVLQAMGRDDEALSYCDKVLAIEPNHEGAWYNRGNAFLRLKRFDEALFSYEKSLSLKPGRPEVLNNIGLALHGMRRSEEALASYAKVLAIKPDHAEAWNNRGAALYLLGRPEEAVASYEKALRLQPEFVDAWKNRGVALQAMARQEEALACYARVLAIMPDHAEVLQHRGDALRDLRRYPEALASYDRALGLNPRNADLLNNRAICLYFLGRNDEALASYDAALAIRPDHADALHSRGMIRWREGQHYHAAVRDLESAIAINPEHEYAQGDLLHLRMHGTAWAGFDELVAQVNAGVRAGRRVVDPFMYLAVSESPADLQACATIFTDHFHPAAPMLWKKAARSREKIRVGYVSGEFRAQATAYLTAGLYEHHDKSRFEIVAFDNGPRSDSPMRSRLEAAFDRFVPIATLSDREAAERIVAEDIDILVNLNGYFGSHRMGVFAHKPAPVQVNFLGFPGTLGARYIDYIIADRFVIPDGEQQFYTEKVVTLPDTYQVNDSRRYRPQGGASRAEHGLPQTGFVFCDFNMSYKLTPALFAVWMRILKSVEGSVLWLLQGNTASPDNLRAEAQRHGVAAERLIFAPFVPMERQLDRLQLADLFLDTMPCNAHTTASDALWAGVPLLTCQGAAFSGRVAASLLQAIDLPELIAADLETYEALAGALAHDPARLQAIRQKLAQRRSTAPLFDTDRYRRHLESAYARMWETFQRGEDPQGFTVAPS